MNVTLMHKNNNAWLRSRTSFREGGIHRNPTLLCIWEDSQIISMKETLQKDQPKYKSLNFSSCVRKYRVFFRGQTGFFVSTVSADGQLVNNSHATKTRFRVSSWTKLKKVKIHKKVKIPLPLVQTLLLEYRFCTVWISERPWTTLFHMM